MQSRRRWIAVLLASVGLGAAWAGARAAEPATSEHELMEQIGAAATADDHAALASFYREQAKAVERKVTEHEAMGEKYAGLAGKADWAGHCRTLASYYRKLAAEYQGLAKLHEGEASKLRGE